LSAAAFLGYGSAAAQVNRPSRTDGSLTALPEICSFEREGDVAKWKAVRATLERSKEHVSEGRYSAKLTVLERKPDLHLNFSGGGYASKDWSGYDKLLIDVYNPMDTVLDSTFEVRLRTSSGRDKEGVDLLSIGDWNGAFPPHQWHTVTMPLIVGISQMSDEGRFNFSDVASLDLRPGGFWKGKGIVLYLDNLRLAKTQSVAKPSFHMETELPAPVYHPREPCAFQIKIKNDGSHQQTVALGVDLEDTQGKKVKSISTASLCFGPHEEKRIEAKGNLSTVPEGRYLLASSLSQEGKSVIRRQDEIILKSSPVYVLADVSDSVCHRNEALGLTFRLRSGAPDQQQVVLTAWLEDSQERKVKSVGDQPIVLRNGAEQTITRKLELADVPEGKYVLVSSLSRKQDTVCDRERSQIRIVPPFVSPLQRDNNYLYFPWKYYMPWLQNPEDFSAFSQEVEQIIDEMGFYDHGILFFPGYYDVGHEMDERALRKSFALLRDLKVPFVVSFFHPSGLEYLQYSYETLTGKAKRMIGLAEQCGGRYFLGIDIPEPENLSPYSFLTSKTRRLEKVDAYRAWIRRLRDDVGLRPNKVWLTRLATGMSYGLNYDASLTLVMQEALMYLSNAELAQSRLRGSARSFGQPWGIDFARWTTEEGRNEVLPYDQRTGRYSPVLQRFCIDKAWWQLDSGPAEDAYKTYIHTYYNGVQFINGQSERPLTDKGGKQAILKFVDFVKKAPRCKEIVSTVGIVESKGSYWSAPTYYPRNWPQGQEVSFSFPVTGTLGGWVSKGRALKEEADFDYLDIFFPGSALADRLSTKYFWTGTPYGAVDVIYPAMKLEGLKRYNTLTFLGYHRMDTVRPDFLDDLMKYVRDGGALLLSVDQLRNSKEALEAEKLEPLLGARVGSGKKAIRDSIEVTEPTLFDFARKKYPIAPRTCKLDHETNPWVYDVIAKGATTVATDSQGVPVLFLHGYGKGYVVFSAAPTLSMLLGPAEKDPLKDSISERITLVRDVVDKVCAHEPQPLDILPRSDTVEFLLSKTGADEAAIFVMNHGARDWSGDIVVNLRAAGLSRELAAMVQAKIGSGYIVKEAKPRITADKDKLIISGISLAGDKDNFCSYRQASFAYIRLGKSGR
jgi:hypothetical protein